MTIRLILIGCGNMGYAMLSSWIGRLDAASVFVVEPNEDLRARAQNLGCQAGALLSAVPANAAPELIVIAVKPQSIRQALAECKRFGGGPTSFLSIAAGVTIATLESILGDRTPIIRCMPNTPVAIGKGMSVICSNPQVSEATQHRVLDLLSTGGRVATVADEDLLDAVTAVSGSGPAYIFYFIEALTAAAQEVGLPLETARLLAMQTTYGAASLAFESGNEPAALRRQVTSPNGTTAAALDVLMSDGGLQTLMTKTVMAAHRKSVELRDAPSTP